MSCNEYQLELLVKLGEKEAKRLMEYATEKKMTTSGVMRQALRIYDWVERTPGAYEAVRALQPELDKRPPRPCGCFGGAFCKECY